MSCGCGCCPKCGCSATCTCNNSLWSLESQSDFSYVDINPQVKTAADEHEERYYFNGDNEHSAAFSARADAYRYAKMGSSRRIIRNESVGCSGAPGASYIFTDIE